MSEEPILLARHLTKRFRLPGRSRTQIHAVDDVDLELHRGRVTALVGESGSGKSTVAKLLARLHPQTSGSIRLHGQEVTATAGRAFRAHCRQVQMIFQDPFASLNPVHTVDYILRRSLRIHQPRLRGDQLRQRLHELLERVHLTPADRYAGKFPHELSGGQRQRVSIARALGARPDVLLADEPVSMLDVSIRLGVLNLLAELRDELDLAILYITHDIASARYFADETIVMYAGRVAERGPSEEITQRPTHPYTRLLVDSAPDPDAPSAAERGSRGEVPNLASPPAGCRFHPRCDQAMDGCATAVPPIFDVGAAHQAACWLYEREGEPA